MEVSGNAEAIAEGLEGASSGMNTIFPPSERSLIHRPPDVLPSPVKNALIRAQKATKKISTTPSTGTQMGTLLACCTGLGRVAGAPMPGNVT